MKTTVEISTPLLDEARAVAVRERTTLRALIEEGLRRVLHGEPAAPPFRLQDGSFAGEGLTAEFEARGGWEKLREAAYPGFFPDDEAGR